MILLATKISLDITLLLLLLVCIGFAKLTYQGHVSSKYDVIEAQPLQFTLLTPNALQDHLENLSRQPFTAQLSVGQTKVFAVMHLHGAYMSMELCERHSFDVLLPEQDINIKQGFSGRHFALLSLCNDQFDLHYKTGAEVARLLGLFLPRVEFAQVHVDGANLGLYLVVENPDYAIKQRYGSTTILHRGHPHFYDDEQPYWSNNSAQQSFEDFLQNYDHQSGLELIKYLNDYIDLDSYLQYLSLMSLVQNVDYRDELILYSHLGKLRAMAWDFDMILHPTLAKMCQGRGYCFSAPIPIGLNDPDSLILAAEDPFDVFVLSDPSVYSRYRSVLQDTLRMISPDIFSQILQSTADEVVHWLKDAGIRRGMPELCDNHNEMSCARGFEEAQRAVRQHQSLLNHSFAVRHHALKQTLSQTVDELNMTCDRAQLHGIFNHYVYKCKYMKTAQPQNTTRMFEQLMIKKAGVPRSSFYYQTDPQLDISTQALGQTQRAGLALKPFPSPG